MTLQKAITDLKLSATNHGKLHALDALAVEYQRVVQAYIDWLIEHEMREPNKYADLPVADVPTCLSARWQRCAWQQACGIAQSWYSNECTTPPVLKNLCLQANANVVKLEPSTLLLSISGCESVRWTLAILSGCRSHCIGGRNSHWRNILNCAVA